MKERELRMQHIDRFELESGAVLTDVRQAYYLDGELSEARDNVVLVFHSLSATPDAVGGWWREMVGPGKPVDTTRWAVLCPNLLGSCFGTTGPADSPLDPFPAVTIRDMVRLIRRLLDELGVGTVALATGGSLGGMLALEWAASEQEGAEAVVAFAAPAALSTAALGWNHIQRRAIADGGEQGLRVARMIGMMLYRTPAEFQRRFGRRTGADGAYEVGSYLEHHGRKIVQSFDHRSYLALLEAIAGHDVGRGRGGVGPALGAFRGRLIGVGVPGDQLYPAEEVRAWAEAGGGEYRSIDSVYGHDGFLLEAGQVGAILSDALSAAAGAARPAPGARDR